MKKCKICGRPTRNGRMKNGDWICNHCYNRARATVMDIINEDCLLTKKVGE